MKEYNLIKRKRRAQILSYLFLEACCFSITVIKLVQNSINFSFCQVINRSKR